MNRLALAAAAVVALLVMVAPTPAAGSRAEPVYLEIITPWSGYFPPGPGEQVAHFRVTVNNSGPPAQPIATLTGLDMSLGLPSTCQAVNGQAWCSFSEPVTQAPGTLLFTVPICSLDRPVFIEVTGAAPYAAPAVGIPADWVANCAPPPPPPPPAPSAPLVAPGGSGSVPPAPTVSPAVVNPAVPTRTAEPAARTADQEGLSHESTSAGRGSPWLLFGVVGSLLVAAVTGAWWLRRRRTRTGGA